MKSLEIINRIESKKVELGMHVELGVIQDEIKKIDIIKKQFDDAFLLISSARQKAIPIIKNAIESAKKTTLTLEQTKKTAKELGVELPKDYLEIERKAGLLVGEAEDIITWINKY